MEVDTAGEHRQLEEHEKMEAEEKTEEDEKMIVEKEKKKLEKATQLLKKLRPTVAVSLTFVGKLVHTAGDVGGYNSLKITGTALESAALWIDPESEEFQKRMDKGIINLQTDVSFIKVQLLYTSDKIDKIYHISGVIIIQQQYEHLMEAKNLVVWAYHFQSNKNRLVECLSDFKKDNVREFLDRIGTTKCKEDMKEFCKCVDLLQTTRAMYFVIQNTYYSHLPDDISKKLTVEDIKNEMTYELEKFCSDIQSIMEIANKLFPFWHVYKTIPSHWPIKLGYIPIIPAEPEFLRKEVKEYETLGGGFFTRFRDSFNSRFQDTVKTYSLTPLNKNEPSLVKTVFPDGHQSIRLELGGVRQDGRYHRRYPSGTILYGNVQWGDGELRDADGYKGRMDLLVKVAGSNKIMYQVVRGRAEEGWVTVEEHTFNPEDGTWKKTK